MTMVPYRVVVHVDEMACWPLALTNLRNLLNDVGRESLRAELVANGPAVAFYADLPETVEKFPSSWQEGFYRELIGEMSGLHSQNVQFIACANALRANHLDPARLLPLVQVVPAGITEIVRKQHEGYAYVKP